MRKLVTFAFTAILAGCSAGEKTTETTITWEQTPVTVRQGIEKAYPDSKVNRVEREVYGKSGIIHYEVEVVTKDGKIAEAEFTPDGEMLEDHE